MCALILAVLSLASDLATLTLPRKELPRDISPYPCVPLSKEKP